MKTVLLPVKDFRNAKQRLSSVLDADSRLGLARSMLADVLGALARTHVPDRVVIFTAEDEAVRMARSFGFDVEIENSVEGHSAAVNRMVVQLSAGASRILSIAFRSGLRFGRGLGTNHADPFTRWDGHKRCRFHPAGTDHNGIW